MAILERALRTDASLELLPSRTWFAGKATCVPYLSQVLGEPGDWQMRPTRMNGQQAAVVHYRGTPFRVAVLSTTATGIRKIVAFAFPDLATQST